MRIELDFPPELESKIRHHAEIAGMDIDRFALALVRAGLVFTDTVETAAEEPSCPPSEQAARFREWVANAPPVRGCGFVDDSRESIYEDRG